MDSFPAKLKRFRLAAGLTQEQLAHLCDYKGQSRIANYENGSRTPRINDLQMLAKALDIGISDLVHSPFPMPDTMVREDAHPYRTLTPDQRAILDIWEALDEQGRKAVQTVGNAIAKSKLTHPKAKHKT